MSAPVVRRFRWPWASRLMSRATLECRWSQSGVGWPNTERSPDGAAAVQLFRSTVQSDCAAWAEAIDVLLQEAIAKHGRTAFVAAVPTAPTSNMRAQQQSNPAHAGARRCARTTLARTTLADVAAAGDGLGPRGCGSAQQRRSPPSAAAPRRREPPPARLLRPFSGPHQSVRLAGWGAITPPPPPGVAIALRCWACIGLPTGARPPHPHSCQLGALVPALTARTHVHATRGPSFCHHRHDVWSGAHSDEERADRGRRCAPSLHWRSGGTSLRGLASAVLCRCCYAQP